MYKFSLNINDEKENLTPENGLPFGELGILISHLDKAINPKDGNSCTLYDVQNHGYTPCFKTESKALYSNFIEVHKNIYEKPLNDLKKEEIQYAKTLKGILAKDKYVEPIDNDEQPIFRITGNEIEKGVDTYSVITNQSGTISEIGSQNLDDTSHIYLHECDFKIYINQPQEEELKKYYKRGVVELKLKQRRSIKSGRIISGLLLSFKVKKGNTIAEGLSDITQEELSSIGTINNYEDIINLLRS